MLGIDLLVLGAVFGVGGSLLLAKSNLELEYAEEITKTYFGSNPYQRRNQITQHVEAIAGAIWLGISLVLLALGTILTTPVPSNEQVSLVARTLGVVSLGAILLLVTLLITRKASRLMYFPKMVQSQREGFLQCIFWLEHDGYEKYEIDQGRTIDSASLNERLARANKTVEVIGALLEIRRKEGETDIQYRQRLKSVFQEK